MDDRADPADGAAVRAFIERWRASGGSERANYQLFLTELCALLDLPQPDPAREETAENAYVFERRVSFNNGDGTTSPGFIDLYRRDCFVLEAKQGSEAERAERPFPALRRVAPGRRKGTAVRGTPAWDDAIVRARGQAEAYAKALPQDEAAILERLVALNRARAGEEARGHIRWLRPDFQAPKAGPHATQTEAELAASPAAAKAAKAPWPKSLADQARAVRGALAAQPGPVSAARLAKSFQRANRARIGEILETLASLGQARQVDGDRYTG